MFAYAVIYGAISGLLARLVQVYARTTHDAKACLSSSYVGTESDANASFAAYVSHVLDHPFTTSLFARVLVTSTLAPDAAE